MQPDPGILMEKIGLNIRPFGLYDAPDPTKFEPLVTPDSRACVFDYFKQILNGKTLHLSKEKFGCPGAGRGLLGEETFSTEGLVKFLVGKEGLKASESLMREWIEFRKPYTPRNGNILIGWLKSDQYEFLKTVTFVVNPDQLSALMTGAQYHAHPDDPAPVISPFGSGCSLLLMFDGLDIPQSILGASDMAMREHLEADQMLFTATKSMFERLCSLDENSFLFRDFWSGLIKSRI